MARLRPFDPKAVGDSDDADFRPMNTGQAIGIRATTRSSPRKKSTKPNHDLQFSSCDEQEVEVRLVPKTAARVERRPKQIRLAPLNATSIARTKPHNFSQLESSLEPSTPFRRCKSSRKIAASTPRMQIQQDDPKTEPCKDNSDAELEVEESVWCGSDVSSESSEDELPSARKLLTLPPPSKKAAVEMRPADVSDSFERSLAATRQAIGKPPSQNTASSRPGSSSDKENYGAFLRFSPPRLYSPPKQQLLDRPQTPPQSPSKSRLQSPSKTRPRVPTPPARPSLDAFWDANAVNDWNDQYSPQKVLKSPKKLNLWRGQEHSPSGSPTKCPSPSKASKTEREAKKLFESSKCALAREFLDELDSKITNGELQRLSATTGGIHLIWSKTLNSTAGRANWRKETTKTTRPDGATECSYKHFASVELAEKVINDSDRLINVIAHEFCHLANFMISGIKDQPHGRQFKEWGRKCTHAFGDRGVEVTTKHTYQIEYKYIWQCSNEDCGAEFKRHSKSIDPNRHTCGSCRAKLVQIKPAPRKDAGNGSGYAAFVKTHFASLKREMPSASHKEVMEAVGRKYRVEKSESQCGTKKTEDGRSKESAIDLDAVVRELEVITLDDD